MAKSPYLDETFHAIIEQLIATGTAPNYAQVAAKLGVSPRKGQVYFRKLFSSLGFPGWLEPKTDNIVSFAPFNNVPTNYRITIDGEQKWFGQWAFESLAVCWLFPGKTIHIDSLCPDSEQPIHVEVCDGVIKKREPESVVAHVSIPFDRWFLNFPYSWGTMDFFRSEVNIDSHKGSEKKKTKGIISLDDLMRLFSGPYFINRRQPDYFSKMGSYLPDMIATMDTLENAGPYWRMKWFDKLGVTLGLKLGLM